MSSCQKAISIISLGTIVLLSATTLLHWYIQWLELPYTWRQCAGPVGVFVVAFARLIPPEIFKE